MTYTEIAEEIYLRSKVLVSYKAKVEEVRKETINECKNLIKEASENGTLTGDEEEFLKNLILYAFE